VNGAVSSHCVASLGEHLGVSPDVAQQLRGMVDAGELSHSVSTAEVGFLVILPETTCYVI
jgi:hypothetical protein